MIERMKKAYIVLLDSEKEGALTALGRLGVVHLEPVAGRGPEYEALARRIGEAERALGILGGYKAPKGAKASRPGMDPLALVDETNASFDVLKALQDEAFSLSREIERLGSWGDFDPLALQVLAEAGIHLRVVEGPATRLGALPEELEYIRLAAPKGQVRLVFQEGAMAASLPGDFLDLGLPSLSLGAMRTRLAEVRVAIDEENRKLALASAGAKALAGALANLGKARTFEAYRSGMETEGQLCHLKGYVPVDGMEALKQEASLHGWGLLSDDPADDENPPTKMRNSALVRIVQPVFDFLGTTPGYREYDISAWFLIFFCIFFAMIFGDAGYGCILLLAGIAGAVGAKRKGRAVPDMLRLLLLLAACTLGYGTVTGTWFGLPTDSLPSFLRSLMIPALAGDNPASPENIKILCFILGTIQISIAHVKNILRDFPDPKFLAQVGWLSAVDGLYFVVLNLVLDPSKYPIPGFALAMVGGGFFLVFLFGSWNGNILKSFLAGLGGLLTQFLGTVSALADIISYIRLFAVGLAGVAISQTVNSMGGGFLGSLVGVLAGLLILVFGHVLNLAMSVLSVIVHGIRLNMLEFSGHLGMEWAGYKYEPFTGVVANDGTN